MIGSVNEKFGSSESFEKLWDGIWPVCKNLLDQWLSKSVRYSFTDKLIFDVEDIRNILGEKLHREFLLAELQVKVKFISKSNLQEISFLGGFEESLYEKYKIAYIEATLEFPKNHSFEIEKAHSIFKYVLRHELQHVYEKMKNVNRKMIVPEDNVMEVVTTEYPVLAELMHKLYLINKSEMNANIASFNLESQEAKKIAYDLRNFDSESTMKDLLEEAKENGYNPKIYHRTFGKWIHRIFKDAIKKLDGQLNMPKWVEDMKNKDMGTYLTYLEKRFKIAGDYMYRKLMKRSMP